jgi:hypothetical protein
MQEDSGGRLMDRKKEKKVKAKVLRVRKKLTVRWKLTEEDREFLRSCNIDPS